MLETNIPEVDVDLLLKRIREEVQRRRSTSPFQAASFSSMPIDVGLNIAHIESLLSAADGKTQVRTQLPKQLNRFPFNRSKFLQRFILKVFELLFRDQRIINYSIIASIRELIKLNQKLAEQTSLLQSELVEARNTIDSFQSKAAILQRQQEINQKELVLSKEQIASFQAQILIGERDSSFVKYELSEQKRLTSLFLEEARKRLPEFFDREQLKKFAEEEKHLIDAFYAAFEDKFRGAREEIKERLKVYLPLISEAKIRTKDSSILDLGCGRGEWLELLTESGYTVRGLDLNRVFIQQCREKGFKVVEGDLIDYLRTVSSLSLGAVTGFHIIEHLPFEVLMNLMRETVRVLKPGGLVIFETPNPQNVLVGSCNFYTDPTHRNPLPSPLVRFLMESCGFVNVRVMDLHPSTESLAAVDSEILEKFNRYFYGPQDYAVIGNKV